MVRFDLNLLAYLDNEHFRVLTAVETGMRNHEIVPCKLVGALSDLRSGTGKILQTLCQNRLLKYERGKKFDGYRLTSLGYDYLALRVLRNRDVIDQVGNQIGVGKEASVYIARNSTKDERYALKVHRLGRTSFRTVQTKRDYHTKSKVSNWLYLSRLAALREYSFMRILFDRGFKIPEPIDNNRHCVVMRWIDGTLLNNISKDDDLNFKELLEQLLNMILELANKYGVVHGDFNEFNLLIDNQTNQPYLIDFPQMISTDHQMAKEYFERDVQCVVTFFEKHFNCSIDEVPTFELIDNDEKIESIAKIANDANEMLNRYLEDNLLLSENFKDKLNLKEIDESSESIDKESNDHQQDSSINSNVWQENESNHLKAINEDQECDFKTESKLDDSNQMKSKIETNELFDQSDHQSTFSYSASRIAGSSIASTFTTDQVRSIIKKEKERKERRETIKESVKKIKGDASSVGRQRKTNKQNIKEDNNIYEWLKG